MSYLIEEQDDDFFELEHPKEEAVAAFVGQVGRALQRVYATRRDQHQLTKTDLAKKLGVEKSRISRCLSGSNNLTLATVAELAWAMDADLKFAINPKESEEPHWFVSVEVDREAGSFNKMANHETPTKVVMAPQSDNVPTRYRKFAQVKVYA